MDDGINSGEGIVINNGDTYVYAQGDGIDSNADLIINGGTIISITANIEGDGGIDADGAFVINGGTVIATGGAMVVTPSNKSTNYSMMLSYSQTQTADKTIDIQDSDNNSIFIAKLAEKYSSLLFSSDELNKGEIYNIYLEGTQLKTNSEDFVISDIVNSYSNVK